MTPAKGRSRERTASTTMLSRRAVIAHRQPAEAIVAMRIDAGIVEDNVPGPALAEARQNILQPIEIGGIAGAVGQRDVEVGRDLADGIVAIAMHREGEDARIAGEYVGGAVALVHVEVDDQHHADGALGQKCERRDGNVVEGAEASVLRAPGMVAAAGGVAGDAVQ